MSNSTIITWPSLNPLSIKPGERHSYDWQKTVEKGTVVQWEPGERGRYPREQEQFKSLLRFCYEELGQEAPRFFARSLKDTLNLFGVVSPEAQLTKDRTKQ
jgi:hypothetical protein